MVNQTQEGTDKQVPREGVSLNNRRTPFQIRKGEKQWLFVISRHFLKNRIFSLLQSIMLLPYPNIYIPEEEFQAALVTLLNSQRKEKLMKIKYKDLIL
jgi:hypothetical protein